MFFFSSQKYSEHLHSPYRLLFSGYLGSFSGVQQSRPEFHHSLPRGVEIKTDRAARLFLLRVFVWSGQQTCTFYSTQMKKVSPSSERVCAS